MQDIITCMSIGVFHDAFLDRSILSTIQRSVGKHRSFELRWTCLNTRLYGILLSFGCYYVNIGVPITGLWW
jgi:hypothetical protein